MNLCLDYKTTLEFDITRGSRVELSVKEADIVLLLHAHIFFFLWLNIDLISLKTSGNGKNEIRDNFSNYSDDDALIKGLNI